MVCGLPDSGYVAKIALDHLVDVLKAKKLADIYSPRLPPQVLIKEDGLAELIGHHLYAAENEKALLYTGDSQPVDPRGAYELSELVVQLAQKYGVRQILIFAAMIRGVIVKEPSVFASATDPKLLEEYLGYGAKKTNVGAITWMHGLLLGEAAKRGVDAVCLSSETQGELPDSKAAEALLRIIEQKLRTKVDMSKLHEKSKEIEELVRGLAEQKEEARERKEPTYIG
jgi:uncharacterized protein (TIGR00162 family)